LLLAPDGPLAYGELALRSIRRVGLVYGIDTVRVLVATIDDELDCVIEIRYGVLHLLLRILVELLYFLKLQNTLVTREKHDSLGGLEQQPRPTTSCCFPAATPFS